MKTMMIAFIISTLSAPVLACSPIWAGDQIVEEAAFLKQINNMSPESEQKCEAMTSSDGSAAVDIKFLSSDENRQSGIVTRSFRAHLLCTSKWQSKPFYDYITGKVTIRYKLYTSRNREDSCDGTVFETVKSVKF